MVEPYRTALTKATADSFGIYHDLIRSSGAAASRLGDAFQMTMTAYHYGRLTLFDRQLVGAEHARDTTQIRRDGFGHYYLQVLRSGRMMSGRPGEERRPAPGDAMLFDADQPMRARVADADYVTVILARDLVEAAAPDARRLHGRILPRVALGSIGAVVLSLARRAPGFTDTVAAAGSQIIADMLGQVEGRSGQTHHGLLDETELELSRRLKAEVFIDANLGADLDVEVIARGTGVSRSSLYRAFRLVGGVEATLIRRRAARLRALIMQPGRNSIAALAQTVGFSSETHCSRAFKEIYGYPPDRLRTILWSDAHSTSHALHVDRMQTWYKTMNDRLDDRP